MEHILIAGAGKIGATIAHLLSNTGDYFVYLADINLENINKEAKHAAPANLQLVQLNILDHQKASEFLQKHEIEAIVSCLPYTCTVAVAKLAKEHNTHYFDLTEDIEAVDEIHQIAKESLKAFVPQCGLAPGFINIVASDLIKKFDDVDEVKLRCGALPQNSSNALQYALNWSTDGLINEYGNPCIGLIEGKREKLSPLDDIEDMQIDGHNYEAFNTSGGIGSLTRSFENVINTMNYKTIRYPGHCEKMRFMMQDLKLNNDRETLKRILQSALPTTLQDVVIIYVSVKGTRNNEFTQENFTRKYYPQNFGKLECSAIQATTASSACAVIDLVFKQNGTLHGRVLQEEFELDDILNNRFGKIFTEQST